MTTPTNPFPVRFSETWSKYIRPQIAEALRETAARLGVAITVAGLIGSEDGGFACYSIRLSKLLEDGSIDPEAAERARLKDPYT